MKIQDKFLGSLGIFGKPEASKEIDKVKVSEGGEPQRRVEEGEGFSPSQDAHKVRILKDMMNKIEVEVDARVDSVKRAIEEGRYRVPSRKVAEKILEEAVLFAVHRKE